MLWQPLHTWKLFAFARAVGRETEGRERLVFSSIPRKWPIAENNEVRKEIRLFNVWREIGLSDIE
jgi:hypothetical protein